MTKASIDLTKSIGARTNSIAAWPIDNKFAMVVMQPTTLCNLDCAYCYLPDRRTQRLMPATVAAKVAASIATQDMSRPVSVVWHGGEPLTTPLGHMRALLAPFETLSRSGSVRHHVQTNATLIDSQWCDVLREYEFRVGVSVDGPSSANGGRLDLAGRETHKRFTRGVQRLHERGIEFHVICVVTPETIGRSHELVEYFASIGCRSVGFNIEEHEGVPTDRRPVDMDEAINFWRGLIAVAARAGVKVRELDQLAAYLGGQRQPSTVEPIPTVAHNGDVVLLSPELAGVAAAEYGNFRAGNILTMSLPAIISNSAQLRYVTEFTQGLRNCASSCTYWDFCRGAQAGNRFFEHGSFDATETNFCRTTRQALITAAAGLIRERSTETDGRPTNNKRRESAHAGA